jgi:hypothetical protein
MAKRLKDYSTVLLMMDSEVGCNSLLGQIVPCNPYDGTRMVGISCTAKSLTFDWCKAYMTHKLSAAQSQMGVIVAAAAAASMATAAAAAVVARAMLTWFGSVVAAVVAAMGVAASLVAVVETEGCSCPLPNNPVTHFDGENAHALSAVAAAAAGLYVSNGVEV